MTKPRDPEALLSAYLADGMEVLPDRVVVSVLHEIHRTRQQAVFSPWRTRSRSLLIAAALLVGLALASVAAVGALRLLQPDPLSLEPRPSLQGVVPPSSVPSQPPAVPTPSAVPSLDLTWTKVDLKAGLGNVAWLGDQFVLIDGAGAVSTSIDGASWHALQPGDPDPGYAQLLQGNVVSWQDNAIGWWNPEDGPDYGGKPPITARDVLRILEPPAALTETTPFKGRIQSIGIGPVGIVAQVHSDLDWDAWVTKKLGARSNNAWVKHLKSVDFRDGILRIRVDNGPGLKVVWADEGFELGDYQDGGFEWYSPDGEQWTAVPAVDPTSSDSGAAFPTGFGDVVGVSDGFIARADAMWHSSDGLTWRKLGDSGERVRWTDAALDGWCAPDRRSRAFRLLDLGRPHRAIGGRRAPGAIGASECDRRHGTARPRVDPGGRQEGSPHPRRGRLEGPADTR